MKMGNGATTHKDGEEEERTRAVSRDQETGRWLPRREKGRFLTDFKLPTAREMFRLSSDKDNSAVPLKDKQELDRNLPIIQPDFEKLEKSGLQVMWIGHASVLVQLDGLTILTDPIFSQRCAPSQMMGPKRYRDPPCTIDELPDIDAVVISHNHYDHLDYNSVVKLNRRFGSKLRWYVGEGQGKWMKDQGCEDVVELTWWQEHALNKNGKTFIFVSTPAQHWSRRGILDSNKALWCSWVVKGPSHSFFFAGDTGYNKGFKQIGDKYGPISLSAIPIGAYCPKWFMGTMHVDPAEAVGLHSDVRSEVSIGIHWGTFTLAHEHYMEPKLKLSEEVEKRGLTADAFRTVHIGDITTVSAAVTS